MRPVAKSPYSALLAKNRLLKELEDSELHELLTVSRMESFGAREPIFAKGDPGDCLYAILHGRIGINSISTDGQEILLNILNVGEIFGEIAVLDGKERTAGAVAIEPTQLLRIDRSDFLPFLEKHPRLCIRLMEVLCERLRWTSDVIEDTIFLEIPRRLAKKLLTLMASFGEPTDRGVQITVKLSQEDLGHMLGVTRESINKGIRNLQDLGIISYDRGYIIVNQMEKLEAIANDPS